MLLGPNGAGKTTLVRACLGLLRTATGWARIHGMDPRDPEGRRCAMERTGVCIEQPGVPGGVTAGTYLEWWARLHSLPQPRQRARAMLAEWDISAEQAAERLSQGQRQILQVLRAMIHDPPLLLLDEPTGTLDPDARQRLHAGLLAWRDRTGGALLLSTHLLDDAIDGADRVAILSRGRLRADAPADVLCSDGSLSRLLRIEPGQNPSTVADVLGLSLPRVRAVPAPDSRGCPAFRLTCPGGESDHGIVLSNLCEAGIAVRSLDRDNTTWHELWNKTLESDPRPTAAMPAPSPLPPLAPGMGKLRSAWITARYHISLALRERRLFAPVLILEAFLLGSISLSTGGLAAEDALGFLLLAGVLPLGLATSLAADTFAGERERRSLETLLCAPLTPWPLFIGKGLAALLPALSASWAAMACAWTILLQSKQVPSWPVAVAVGAFVVPTAGMLSTSFALTASRKARSTRSASQIAALSLLPLLATAQFAPRLLGTSSGSIIRWIGVSIALAAASTLLLARSASRSSPTDLMG